jgi:transposase-like protein
MTKQKYSKEVRERAVRMVREHQPDHSSEWATIQSVAAKLGCTPQTLHNWLRKAQVDAKELKV